MLKNNIKGSNKTGFPGRGGYNTNLLKIIGDTESDTAAGTADDQGLVALPKRDFGC